VTVLYLLAGLLLGSAFLWPGLCWLAVPAIAVTACALARRENRVWRPIGGLLLGSAVSGTMILFWVFATLHEMFGFSTTTAALAVATSVVTLALLSQLPACLFLLAAWRVPGLARIPVWLWFPLTWALGELLLPTPWGALLYSQWANGSVLRAVYQFGWYPTLLVFLVGASALGASGATRRWQPAALSAAIFGGLALLPAMPGGSRALVGVGAVQMADIEQKPAHLPAELGVLIWPEGAVARRPYLEEGAADGSVRLETLPQGGSTEHIVGLVARSRAGYLNAAARLGPDLRVLGVRAKSVLAPGIERPMMWMRPAGEETGFQPGHGVPLLTAGGKRIIPVICYEVLDRPLLARGAAAGGQVIAVLANDRSIRQSSFAMRHLLGALILRSVELHLPAVRASMWGPAALVSEQGAILALSPPGASRLLTLAALRRPDMAEEH
jgi:hypothetical protein